MWDWGQLHHNLDTHPLAAIVDEATRAKFNASPMPEGGSPCTPNQSTYRVSGFLQTSGPLFRTVVDVDD